MTNLRLVRTSINDAISTAEITQHHIWWKYYCDLCGCSIPMVALRDWENPRKSQSGQHVADQLIEETLPTGGKPTSRALVTTNSPRNPIQGAAGTLWYISVWEDVRPRKVVQWYQHALFLAGLRRHALGVWFRMKPTGAEWFSTLSQLVESLSPICRNCLPHVYHRSNGTLGQSFISRSSSAVRHWNKLLTAIYTSIDFVTSLV